MAARGPTQSTHASSNLGDWSGTYDVGLELVNVPTITVFDQLTNLVFNNHLSQRPLQVVFFENLIPCLAHALGHLCQVICQQYAQSAGLDVCLRPHRQGPLLQCLPAQCRGSFALALGLRAQGGLRGSWDKVNMSSILWSLWTKPGRGGVAQFLFIAKGLTNSQWLACCQMRSYANSKLCSLCVMVPPWNTQVFGKKLTFWLQQCM